MCIKIKSCKPLNPTAQEWRPPPRRHIPPPAPPQAAALIVTDPLPQKLPCQLPSYHPIFFHHSLLPYISRAWPHTVHYATTFCIPATGGLYAAPTPISSGEMKRLDQPWEKNDTESCVVKLRDPIVDGRKSLSRMWRLRSRTAPPPRRKWKLKTMDGGGDVDGGASSRRSVSCSEVAAAVVEKDSSSLPRTTVMIRNIPNQLRRDFVLEFIDSYCSLYSLEYDFMYLPMDFIKGDNLGYAFLNLTSEENALKLKEILQNYRWGNVKTKTGHFYLSTKICEVTWARIQGKERLVKRFEESTFACEDASFLPVVFEPPRGQTITTPVVVGKLQVSKGPESC